VRALGAGEALDYNDSGWPAAVRRLCAGRGAAAANAVPERASIAVRAVADCGRLVTTTSDPPPAGRGIELSTVTVRPDGHQLSKLAGPPGAGLLTLNVA